VSLLDAGIASARFDTARTLRIVSRTSNNASTQLRRYTRRRVGSVEAFRLARVCCVEIAAPPDVGIECPGLHR
jgi:hypothetical protein